MRYLLSSLQVCCRRCCWQSQYPAARHPKPCFCPWAAVLLMLLPAQHCWEHSCWLLAAAAASYSSNIKQTRHGVGATACRYTGVYAHPRAVFRRGGNSLGCYTNKFLRGEMVQVRFYFPHFIVLQLLSRRLKQRFAASHNLSWTAQPFSLYSKVQQPPAAMRAVGAGLMDQSIKPKCMSSPVYNLPALELPKVLRCQQVRSISLQNHVALNQ